MASLTRLVPKLNLQCDLLGLYPEGVLQRCQVQLSAQLCGMGLGPWGRGAVQLRAGRVTRRLWCVRGPSSSSCKGPTMSQALLCVLDAGFSFSLRVTNRLEHPERANGRRLHTALKASGLFAELRARSKASVFSTVKPEKYFRERISKT